MLLQMTRVLPTRMGPTSAPRESSMLQQQLQSISIDFICLPELFPFRELTKREKVLQGLATGRDAPLVVKNKGVAKRGVFATAVAIGCALEYKTTTVYMTKHDRDVAERGYILKVNGVILSIRHTHSEGGTAALLR